MLNIYIYDIEIFKYDWIVIFKKPTKEANFTVIHNDVNKLREFMKQDDLCIGGFNNKHYDNYILKTILNGCSHEKIKEHNDFIIGGKGAGWDFRPLDYQDEIYHKLPCYTFDLKDDTVDMNLSLKAIEGNLGLPIIESSVPFDLNRKLTKSELDEVIEYCKYDVDSTIRLYDLRLEDYIEAKSIVAEMYNIPIGNALGLTNAKLSAWVLDAQMTKRDDERDYKIPSNIDLKYIPQIVYDFFMQIRDKSISSAKLFGDDGVKPTTLNVVFKTARGSCPVTYAWGGVHGAKPCVQIESTKDRVILNYDVGSLYPNSMINFGFCSRSMKDPKAYEDLVKKRLAYKKQGDKKRANALKLIVNTVYGAMLNQYNHLCDKWAGRSVCITNELAMTMLIVQLGQACESIDFININTDGVMFAIDVVERQKAQDIIDAWCDVTGFEMELDDYTGGKVIQKDVNNYIAIKSDGDFKTKGGYVSLYDKGSFKSNSLRIIHRAVVDYLVKGIPVEDTIRGCNDILQFQQIIKKGGTYDAMLHTIEGERVEMQKVNRIYAIKDERYGEIESFKVITEKRRKNKDTGKMDVIKVDPPITQYTKLSECPKHCYVDNENKLKDINELDLDYYIDMAKRRIDKYINSGNNKRLDAKLHYKEIKLMTTKEETKSNIYAKLLKAREMFANAGVKKSGVNTYADFDYFTLDDIIPTKNKIFKELGLIDTISFTDETAVLRVFDIDNPSDSMVFTSQLASDESLIKNPIQKVGAVQTYVRRYLNILMLDIVENEVVDAIAGKEETSKAKAPATKKATKSTKPKTVEERKEIKEEVTNQDGAMTETQKKSLLNGLKKLRARYMGSDKVVFDDELEAKYGSYVNKTAKVVKGGTLTKGEAEALLQEIGNKIYEE